MDFPQFAWAAELWGRDTPKWAMTDMVKPEQSAPFVRLVPPHT